MKLLQTQSKILNNIFFYHFIVEVRYNFSLFNVCTLYCIFFFIFIVEVRYNFL